MKEEIPLFPLGTVLFPGGPLPLRVFEPRYLDMVSDCLRNDRVFGVCLIKDGREVGTPAEPFAIGTTAKIVDWDQTDDGLLAITAIGKKRFRILDTEVRQDDLLVGECEAMSDASIELPAQHSALANLVLDLIGKAPHIYAQVEQDATDASWVSYRLAELMPLPMPVKQQLLEIEQPLERLDQMVGILRQLQERGGEQ